jgi:D-3-phosphoglycerate dehydrogenase / 2-oxoglutarate reductase
MTERYKVVITDFGSPENAIEAEVLQNSGLDIELVRLQAKTPDELFPHVVDAHGLIVQWVQITSDVINKLQNCKVISRYGIGVDMVDLSAAARCGIPVCNTPDYCIEEVSTHTIGFLLMLNRRMLPQHQYVVGGQWGTGKPSSDAPVRLSKQCIGVVGMGNIGRAVAERARCLGLRVLAYDPYLPEPAFAAVGAESLPLDDLLAMSDYVSIHTPLTDETRGLISTAQFARMKQSAFLINMARGPVVDQVALYEALTSKRIAGAALDVLSKEPPAADDPLLKLDNMIFTPHTSSWSAESLVQLRRETANHVVVALRGERPRSVVNRKELGW